MFNKNIKQKQEKVVKKNKNNDLKGQKNNKKPKKSQGFYYSFLTIILILCLIQISVSAILNISKIISYKAKIVQITNTKNAAQALNEQLQDNIKNFSNVAGLEAIARNNLKMSSEDEVLVIINSPKEEVRVEKSNLLHLKKHD